MIWVFSSNPQVQNLRQYWNVSYKLVDMKWPRWEWASPHNQKQNRNINSLQMQFRLAVLGYRCEYFASRSEKEQDCKFHCWAQSVFFFCHLGEERHLQSSPGSNLVKKSAIPSVISKERLETQHFTQHFHVLMFVVMCVYFFLCVFVLCTPPLRSMKPFKKPRLAGVVHLCSWAHLYCGPKLSAFSICWTLRKLMGEITVNV